MFPPTQQFLIFLSHSGNAFDAGAYIGGIKRDGSDGTKLPYKAKYIHPAYNGKLWEGDDVMLIKLAGFSNAPLQELSYTKVTGGTMVACGYGDQTAGGNDPPDNLLKVSLDFVDDATCEDVNKPTFPFINDDKVLCAGTVVGQDTCQVSCCCRCFCSVC